jgi:hypothetical protein
MTIETNIARDIVSSLAVVQPLIWFEGTDCHTCFFCDAKTNRGHDQVHNQSCLWKRARDLCFPGEVET